MTEEILEHLKNDLTPYKEVAQFSNKQGIYALAFIGDKFPLTKYKAVADQFVYIGKTESNKKTQDLQSHFEAGETGRSTLRRSLGALLMKKLKLTAIPRSQEDIDAGKKFHFMFDNASEEKLSEWMEENLSVAFYEHKGSKRKMDPIETDVIAAAKPVLNIDYKNPDNDFLEAIKDLRSAAAKVAYGKNEGLLADLKPFVPKEREVVEVKKTKAKAETPAKEEKKAPAKAKAETPAKAEKKAPAKAKTETTAKAEKKAPAKAKAETPAKEEKKAPAKAKAVKKVAEKKETVKEEEVKSVKKAAADTPIKPKAKKTIEPPMPGLASLKPVSAAKDEVKEEKVLKTMKSDDKETKAEKPAKKVAKKAAPAPQFNSLKTVGGGEVQTHDGGKKDK